MSKELLTAEKQIENFLNDKKNKDYHYNHLKAEEYKISSGVKFLISTLFFFKIFEL